MYKFFVLLAILLILTGALMVAVPRDVAPVTASRGAMTGTQSSQQGSVTLVGKARDLAELVNAPLSILFGLVSLFYSRRTYLAQGNRK